MGAGREWPAEWSDEQDPITGGHVRRLTNYKGHSHHLYFTNPGWYDGGRRLLFGSDRENRTNLFSLDLQTGEITQLTDLDPVTGPRELRLQRTSVNPTRPEAYFWYDRDMVALDLETFGLRTIFTMPEGFVPSQLDCTADGAQVVASYFEDFSDRLRIDYGRGYVGFRETFEVKPLSHVVRVPVAGGGEVIREEKCWIGHVNTSPTRANLITFCHEGPWDLVDNRIWGMDIETGETWRIRPCEGREAVGHEYWHADGEHIGYHGRRPDGRKFFGHIRWDNTGRIEVAFPHETGHIHSNDFSLVVGDAKPVIRMWRWNGEDFDGPRVLCEHRSSMHVQVTHVHPRFTPDGTQVLYTSDRSGYGNLYLADVPEFGSLSTLEEVIGN